MLQQFLIGSENVKYFKEIKRSKSPQKVLFFTKNALMPSISKICPDMVYLGVKKNFFIGGKEVVFNDGFKNTHFTEFIID